MSKHNRDRKKRAPLVGDPPSEDVSVDLTIAVTSAAIHSLNATATLNPDVEMAILVFNRAHPLAESLLQKLYARGPFPNGRPALPVDTILSFALARVDVERMDAKVALIPHTDTAVVVVGPEWSRYRLSNMLAAVQNLSQSYPEKIAMMPRLDGRLRGAPSIPWTSANN